MCHQSSLDGTSRVCSPQFVRNRGRLRLAVASTPVHPMTSNATCEDAASREWCLRISAASKCSAARAQITCRRTCHGCSNLLPRIFVYPNPERKHAASKLTPGDMITGMPQPWAIAPNADTGCGSYLAPLLYSRLKRVMVPPQRADFFVTSLWRSRHHTRHRSTSGRPATVLLSVRWAATI